MQSHKRIEGVVVAPVSCCCGNHSRNSTCIRTRIRIRIRIGAICRLIIIIITIMSTGTTTSTANTTTSIIVAAIAKTNTITLAIVTTITVRLQLLSLLSLLQLGPGGGWPTSSHTSTRSWCENNEIGVYRKSNNIRNMLPNHYVEQPRTSIIQRNDAGSTTNLNRKIRTPKRK